MEEPAWAAVLRLGALVRPARAHVLGDVDVPAHPQGEAPHQRPRLGSPKVPPERAVVELAEHLDAQSAVRLALAAAIEKAATYQKRPTPRRGRAINEGRSVPVDERTQGRRRAAHDRPEERVVGELLGECLDEGRGEKEVVRAPAATAQPLCRSLAEAPRRRAR